MRKKFKENRIHFAIVCASTSCPVLQSQAYTAEKLGKQLKGAAFEFLQDESKNKFDDKAKKWQLSAIFKWFKDDFGKNEAEFIAAIEKLRGKESAEKVFIISYLPYNWNLNELK